MRFHLLAVVVLLAGAAPASAQRTPSDDQRIDRLEQEMRAVQRKVFPGGNVEPEIRQEAPMAMPSGVPTTTPVADLTARIDALEAQLASLTGQVEQNGHRLQQLENSMTRFRTDLEARVASLEAKGAPPSAVDNPTSAGASPQPAAATSSVPPPVGSADPAEDAYNAGFRLWEQKRYADAEASLEAMAKQYPHHSKASWARNLAGRAYFDEGKPAAAAKTFLANYETDPKGERAPDSLLYLGQALTKLGKTGEACQVYSELQNVYGSTLRATLRQQLPKARADAKCAS